MSFLTQIRKIRNYFVKLLLLGLIGGIIFPLQQVLASTYGSGGYNTCGYGTSCPSSSSPTSSTSQPQTTNAAQPAQILLNDFSEYFTAAGKQLTLETGQVVSIMITVNGTTVTKTITIGTITADYVDVVIAESTGNNTVRFLPGDTKQFDLDGDGKNDIEITLTSITDGKANFVFKAVLGASTTTNTAKPASVSTPTHSKSWIIWLVASLSLLILGMWFFIVLFWRRRNKHNPSTQW